MDRLRLGWCDSLSNLSNLTMHSIRSFLVRRFSVRVELSLLCSRLLDVTQRSPNAWHQCVTSMRDINALQQCVTSKRRLRRRLGGTSTVMICCYQSNVLSSLWRQPRPLLQRPFHTQRRLPCQLYPRIACCASFFQSANKYIRLLSMHSEVFCFTPIKTIQFIFSWINMFRFVLGLGFRVYG